MQNVLLYMLNFYPGPSKLYPQIREYLTEAFDSGILEMNHRSEVFMVLLKNTIQNFKIQQHIPEDYQVYFTSSATECWEIVNQSLLHGKVQFLYNGAFGKKWFRYAVTNQNTQQDKFPTIRGTRFSYNQSVISSQIDTDNNFICIDQNETSNGTQISHYEINKLNSNALLCLDVTSSIGGTKLPWRAGDVWLASSQKCLGLPSGLGILIISPKAISEAEKWNERNHYNSLLFIKENFEKYQTPYTPNILGIYLLNQISQYLEHIDQIDIRIKNRAEKLENFINERKNFKLLIENRELRSQTVIAIEASKDNLAKIKQKAAEKEIILGNGYGEWKENTFRIANFPAIPDNEFDLLMEFLKITDESL